jgi:hypothetical protein
VFYVFTKPCKNIKIWLSFYYKESFGNKNHDGYGFPAGVEYKNG